MTDDLDRVYVRVLLLRCQTGDEAAFAELVVRYHDRLGGYLRRLLGDPNAADALQDVWLAVWRGLPRLTDLAAFEPWAFRIARDRAFGELRRRRPMAAPLPDDELPHAGAEDEFTLEDAARVRSALDRLPPEQRDAIGLRYLDGLTYEQIANVIGRPVGTVRSRIHYAKLTLRGILEREDVS